MKTSILYAGVAVVFAPWVENGLRRCQGGCGSRLGDAGGRGGVDSEKRQAARGQRRVPIFGNERKILAPAAGGGVGEQADG